MLSPFKTFLNNLQKNAGATIFGLSSTTPDPNANTTSAATNNTAPSESTPDASVMSATSSENYPNHQPHPHEPAAASDPRDPVAAAVRLPAPPAQLQPQLDSPDASVVEFYTEDDQLSQPSCDDDPLSDPLALEDNGGGATEASAATVESTEITLVDVNRLRSAENEAQQASAVTMEQRMLQFDEVVAEIAGLAAAAASTGAEDGGGSSGLEEAGARSDGSDSGLGLESSTSSSTTTLAMCGATAATAVEEELTSARSACATASARQPLRTALKRRSNTSPTFAADCDLLGSGSSDPTTITSTTTSALNSPASAASTISASASAAKRAKRHIHFNDVTVYYFQRQQGFMCVPSQGGCSLGMAATHMYRRRFSLAEFAAEQRRVQRHKAQELKRSAGLPVSSSEESGGSDDDDDNGGGGPTDSTSAAVAALLLGTSPAEAAAAAAAASSDSSDDDNESPGIQPVSARQRRVLLKAAGVRKIDASEKKECRAILVSRDNCGCSCRGFCDPEQCACAQSGIKCQVDRLHYPCGCSRDGCGNPVGRGEFNKARVKTHYIHTFLRLQLESKPVMPVTVMPVAVPVPAPMPLPAIPPLLPAMRSAGSSGWHSQVGRSLAAMSGDNLYNMNGAASTSSNTSSAIPSLPLPHELQLLDSGADLLYPFAGDEDAFDGATAAAAMLEVESGTGAGAGSGLNTPTNFGGGAAASTVASAFAVLSSASAAASAMYSPDSASIVEMPAAAAAAQPLEAEVLAGYAAAPKYLQQQQQPATSGYSEYGNGHNQITGYQHSYLYSLQQLQQHRQDYMGETQAPVQSSSGYQHSYLHSLLQPKPSPSSSPATASPQQHLQLQTTATAASSSYPHPNTTSCDTNNAHPFDVDYALPFQGAGATTATTTLDHLLMLPQDQEPPNRSAQRRLSASAPSFELVEPIDFESELDSTFIDKSLKQCVPSPAAIVRPSTSNGHHHQHPHPLAGSYDDDGCDDDNDEYGANGADVNGLVAGQ